MIRFLLFASLAITATTFTTGCKQCKKGKPCGSTCISRSDTCHIQ